MKGHRSEQAQSAKCRGVVGVPGIEQPRYAPASSAQPLICHCEESFKEGRRGNLRSLRSIVTLLQEESRRSMVKAVREPPLPFRISNRKQERPMRKKALRNGIPERQAEQTTLIQKRSERTPLYREAIKTVLHYNHRIAMNLCPCR